MSLQERTLVVKNFDPERMTNNLLKELCMQGGPVRNVVIRPDHAFVEYEDVESVGYTKALLDGIAFQGKNLSLEPKLRSPHYYKHTALLHDHVNYDKQCKAMQQAQMYQQQQTRYISQLGQQQQLQFAQQQQQQQSQANNNNQYQRYAR